jgi:hypothetical protein
MGPRQGIDFVMVTIDNILKSYKTFLEVKYPLHHSKFCKLAKQNVQGAKAEAVLFSIMRSTLDEAVIGEDISTGGPDFLCTKNSNKFLLEVTSLEAEAVARQSGWPDSMPEGVTSGSFQMITNIIRRKASKKAGQLSGQPMPRVLAITCEHKASDVLLGPLAAETVLTSDTTLNVPIGRPISNIGLSTDLKESVFIRNRNGELEFCRESISAVLLVSIQGDNSRIVGLLHPKPSWNFPYNLLQSVPFCRIKKESLEKGYIETEWVIGVPIPATLIHTEVKFKRDELRVQ